MMLGFPARCEVNSGPKEVHSRRIRYVKASHEEKRLAWIGLVRRNGSSSHHRGTKAQDPTSGH